MHFSPDPPNYLDKDFSPENVNELNLDLDENEDVSTDISEDESTGETQFFYQLLPQDMVQGISSENFQGYVTEEDYIESNEPQTVPTNTEEEVSSEMSYKERIELEVNDEEVRAAMRNVTLPTSSIPPWAVTVPESQWTSFLLSRISLLRSNNKPQPSSL